MNNTKLIFLHLPKTGGTTLRTIIDSQYKPSEVCGIYDGDPGFLSKVDFIALPEKQRVNYLAYSGHQPFGLHEHIPAKTTYYAMLRDPVERIISYYHHALTHAPALKKNPISLIKFLNRGDLQVDNLQTRFLSGLPAKFKETSPELLWRAIDNLNTKFISIGITEQYDESISVLSQKMGWNTPDYQPINVGHGRPALDYFSQMEINQIRNLNQFDIALYDYAQRKLSDQFESSCSITAPLTAVNG